MIADIAGVDRELLKYPKFDVHTHIGVGGERASRQRIEAYLAGGERLGITRICISRPFQGIGSATEKPDVMAAANDMVVKAVRAYPERILGYAFVHAGYYDWSIEQMDRCLAVPGLIGVKLYHQYFFNDPAVVALIRAAAERNCLILLHQGKTMDRTEQANQPLISDGAHIAALGRAVPEAKIIAGHIGGGGDWEWTVKALKAAPSVYLDTSGSVIDAGMVDFAAGQLGVNRLLFATDMSLEEGVGKIMAANLSVKAKKDIFWNNAERLLREVRQ